MVVGLCACLSVCYHASCYIPRLRVQFAVLQLLKHVANAMQRAEHSVLERALILFSMLVYSIITGKNLKHTKNLFEEKKLVSEEKKT